MTPQAIPNLVSMLRIGIAAAMVPTAALHWRAPFVVMLASALVTDALDGFLARVLDAGSALGRRLDSWGDYALILALVPGLFLLWPDVMRREAWWITVAVLAYFAPTAWSLWCWRRAPYLHTWASKALAVVGPAALLLLLLGATPVPFRIACALQVAAATEEFLILKTLPGVSGVVPSLRHARRRAEPGARG